MTAILLKDWTAPKLRCRPDRAARSEVVGLERLQRVAAQERHVTSLVADALQGALLTAVDVRLQH